MSAKVMIKRSKLKQIYFTSIAGIPGKLIGKYMNLLIDATHDDFDAMTMAAMIPPRTARPTPPPMTPSIIF